MFIANIVSGMLAQVLAMLFNYTAETSQNQAAIVEMLLSPYMLLMVINAVIFAPIVEELVFRKAFFLDNKKVGLLLIHV